MREQKVAVAIVRDQQGRYLLTYNTRWQRYAFPMKDVDPASEVLPRAAIASLEHDLGQRFPSAQARELEYLGQFGFSGRTDEATLYEYWAFDVQPGEPLNLPAGGDHPPCFRSYEDLVQDQAVSWSTREIARTFVENQEVALAVIPRLAADETQYLVVWNDNYGGFFFPGARIKQEFKPDSVARAVVRSDLGYRGETVVFCLGEVPSVQFSTRFGGRERNYRFHVCKVSLPALDLNQPLNVLEQKLRARGKRWLWVTAHQLGEAGIPFSPTLVAVKASVIHAIPPVRRNEPLRRSEGGVALIRREVAGQTEWLARWNDPWKAFFFVGGHRLESESFRACVIRETGEELGLSPDRDFLVAADPLAQLEYIAFSRRANVDTAYAMQLFEVTLQGEHARRQVEADPRNRWLTAQEICRQEAFDARPVSVTLPMLLTKAGLLDCLAL